MKFWGLKGLELVLVVVSTILAFMNIYLTALFFIYSAYNVRNLVDILDLIYKSKQDKKLDILIDEILKLPR